MTRISPRPAFTYVRKSKAKSKKAQPVWEIAKSFPVQGQWTEDDYLALPDDEGQKIELVDGCLEFLPMPTLTHQRIAKRFFRAFDRFVEENVLGEVFYDGTKTKLSNGQIRLPDIIVVL